MKFVKLNAPTLKELFVKELEAMILSGKLKIGEKLPPERVLAENMKVSRAVVNGGIAELARKGFLLVKPRSGVYVEDYRRYGTVEILLSIMNYNGGQLRRDEIRSILEIKMIVDRLAVELAAKKHSPEDILIMEKELEEMSRPNQEIEKAANAAFEFYHELAMVGGNTLLPLIYRSFRIPVIHLWIRFIQKYGNAIVCSSAAAILSAIKAGDIAAGVTAAENGIAESIQGSKEIYDD